MKSMEQKKVLANFSRPIKLKFENIKDPTASRDLQSSSRTTTDINTIIAMEKCLGETAKNGQPLANQNVATCLQLIRRLKSLVNNEHSDSSKLKFRIVKSAKKFSKLDEPQHKSPSPQPLLTNGSQVSLSNPKNEGNEHEKQNQEKIPKLKSDPFNLSTPAKLKIKTNSEMCGSGASEVKNVSSDEIVKKMRLQIRRLANSLDEKCQNNEELLKQVAHLQNQNSRMKQERMDMGVKIELQFSLLVLQPQTPAAVEPVVVSQTSSPVGQEDSTSGHTDSYQSSTIEHLKMIVVCQSKEIQNLRQRVVN